MLSGGIFLNTLRNYRIGWIGGRYGGGKTAISVRLGYEFISRQWSDHMVCNFPCAIATDLDRISDFRNLFIVLDEAGAWLDGKEFDMVIAFLRKRNLTVVMPSVMPPPLKGKSLNIQRTVNWNTIGMPLWQYQMRLDYMNVKERSNLMWWNPREVFGLWDTSAVTTDSEGITERIYEEFYGEKAQQERAARGRGKRLNVVPAANRFSAGDGIADLDQVRRATDDLDEVATKLTDAVSVSRKGRRRGRD